MENGKWKILEFMIQDSRFNHFLPFSVFRFPFCIELILHKTCAQDNRRFSKPVHSECGHGRNNSLSCLFCSSRFILIMKIKSIELIEINLPLVHFFETSFGRTYERRIILTRVREESGAEGWGEVTCGETPSYSEEWTDSAWATLEKILAPMVLGKQIESASQIWDVMKKVRGHRMAKAAIETACWDLEAKQTDVPLWKHLGGTRREIACGVSIGIQDSVEQLFQKIRTELDAGYQRIKIKIKPDWDFEVIRRVREKFGTILLMGDANSAYSLDDIDLFKRMDAFDLMMFEQPLAHDDMLDHAKLQREIKTPVCLDESVRSPADARKAIELNACRIINVKLGRVGGHAQAKLIEETCRSANLPIWCGGMLESGIGRAHNIAMSTLPGFTLPGDVSASRRYWHEDIIEPEVKVTENGTIIAPEAAGIGFAVKRGRIDKLTTRRQIVTI
jgi:O-succinylbenzoate synthase